MIPTYCNPLPIPDYPAGRLTKGKNAGWGWTRHSDRYDFRELADPSVLYHDGTWYLYPSGRMVYVSDDFVSWRWHPMEPEDIGYAPTVVAHEGAFYLTACGAGLWRADSPLGPFEEIGKLLKPAGEPIDPYADPMLFSDDDGSLYLYWGLGVPGIWGARLDPDQLNRCATEPKLLFSYNPEHEWERFGDYHEDPSRSFVEGAWMIKLQGRYFLTYAAPGTELTTYAMGTYTADQPLGPFQYQQRNPILRDPRGLVHGPGHGCLVRGPDDTLWAFYTCLARVEHYFERRLGMDPAGLDEDGNLFVRGASEIPQLAPGQRPHPEQGNDAGLLPVTANKPVTPSSAAPGRSAFYALDHHMRTWWQAADDDSQPSLEIDLQVAYEVAALRLVWHDVGLDYEHGITPGPRQFLLEAQPPGGDDWEILLDARDNQQDLLCDFRPFAPRPAGRLRLTITGGPDGLATALINVTVFGHQPPDLPQP